MTSAADAFSIDGVDVREMPLHELRALFSLVLQDVHLFTGTIADNIRLGNVGDHRRAGRGALRQRCMPTASFDELTEGYAQPGRRTGRDAVGRAETAAVVRAGPGVRSAHPRARRSHVERRHRNRASDPRRAARPDGRAHDDRDRASPLDDSGHGQDSRPAQG